MESLGVNGAFPEGEWESFSKMFSAEELDFTPQFLLGHDHHAYDHQDQNSLLYSLGNINCNLQYISEERSYCSSHENNYYYGDAKHIHIPVVANDICVMDEKIINIGSFFPAFPDIVMGDDHYHDQTAAFIEDGRPEDIAISGNELVQKRKLDVPECRTKEEDKTSENAKKKTRVSRNVQKSKKNVKSKKNAQKMISQLEEEISNGGGRDGQSSSGCSSDDDNANSLETNGGATSDSKDSAALNLSGKTRASRGSATDPQSLYARKRRERINERLRILQGLVPNGTKVDISTMLEEAVHYVKFLQLQIKLLSSDDMWMYAPIAYNGMDIGLISQKISPPL